LHEVFRQSKSFRSHIANDQDATIAAGTKIQDGLAQRAAILAKASHGIYETPNPYAQLRFIASAELRQIVCEH
jgi:hypothetical protein